jgi:cysteine synthase A
MSKRAVFGSILEAVGNTPVVQLSRLTPGDSARLFAKIEGMNPMGSVKDRVAVGMVVDAERKGLLKPGATVVEPTSGNTGIGLAMVCAVKGYKLILTMPETMSSERRRMLSALGAELVLTPGELGMKGAVDRAGEIAETTPGAFMPQQFRNRSNPDTHERTTAAEIVQAMDSLDAFVAGVGTGGTISGVGRVLKKRFPGIRIVAVEPSSSAVLSGEKPGEHGIQGIGAGFVPEVLDRSVCDSVEKVTLEEAASAARMLAQREGILAGISSGAAIHVSLRVAREIGRGKSVLTILPDTGERYLSTDLFEGKSHV